MTDTNDLVRARAELTARLTQITERGGSEAGSAQVRVYRYFGPTDPVHGVYEPSLCVVAQGRKQITLGRERRVYDPDTYLLVSAALPVTTQVIAASDDCPYLCVGLPLDPALVGGVLMEAGSAAGSAANTVRALDVSRLEFGLLDAVVRAVRLLDAPGDIPMLLPLVLREIVYRLLAGGQGPRLRQIAVAGGQLPQIAGAIDWLRRHFDQPLRMETLAAEVGMSVSGLHHHFKAVTAMSPLQFQKQMRLQEARRLMFAEGQDAAGAGLRVGYDDPSQFSREYRRLYGAPPRRDVAQMRDTLAGMPRVNSGAF